ncbi:PREDICTED: non-specific lipid-transfer protein A [Theobroma cacao]|uniref:Non-specific lipid-transfer protein A n=2 Tax=Theobroma cacao TaxID=3641 RepID=A0AB32V8E8_THECC|nr:PREDICTED: non-specific lipid-transfer protein A [Theobroma cacao]EOY04044.1 Nonspecific lipid-transfer protein, putative [Theobroma cacao]
MDKKVMGFPWSIGLGVVGLVILVATAYAVDAMTCQQAITTLMPCQPFLTGAAPAPTVPCCLAVSNVNTAATTTQARRDLCECFEKAAPGFGVKPEKAKQLPQLCGVTVPVPIDPTINCKDIQ